MNREKETRNMLPIFIMLQGVSLWRASLRPMLTVYTNMQAPIIIVDHSPKWSLAIAKE